MKNTYRYLPVHKKKFFTVANSYIKFLRTNNLCQEWRILKPISVFDSFL